MAVFTAVSETDLSAWLARYNVGKLVTLTPISEGIENSNYFVTTDAGQFVLTMFERLPAEDLPFYLNLMAHLARAEVPVPAPIADRSAGLFSLLNGKPACLVTRIAGAPSMQPSASDCAALGEVMAHLHIASMKYRPRMTNKRGPGWMLTTSRSVRRFLDADQTARMEAEIVFQRKEREARADKLPHGAIHADLFRDNALFSNGAIAGIIDFGFAATDCFVYDVAIAANDWCIDHSTGEFVPELLHAFARAYQRTHPLSADEIGAWPAMLRLGALRFWLSRLHDLHLPRPGEIVHPHDPTHFERILNARIAHVPAWPD
jgi:homoserine kinase type II